MKKSVIAAALCAGIASTCAVAEVDISGFASVVGGKVLSGEGVPEFGLGLAPLRRWLFRRLLRSPRVLVLLSKVLIVSYFLLLLIK